MNPVTCMFVELCYRAALSDVVQAKNTQFSEKALTLKNSIKPSLDWHCETFATMNSEYKLVEDPLFAPLVLEVGQAVADFAAAYGVRDGAVLRCIDGWINVAQPGDHQEMHIHPGSHFSAVYYVDAPENCGNLVLRSHESLTDMHPIPSADVTQAGSKTYFQTPKTGDLVIFRSNLPHMVATNKSNAPRISVALNFVFG